MGSLTRANTKQVAQILVHRPPLREQKKLIAKVDELMALCDRLEAQLKERDIRQATLAKAALAKFTEDPTPENLQLLFHPSFSIEPKDLRQAIVTLAVQGKIQVPDSETNSAEEIVGRIDRLRPTENPPEVTQNERPWLIPKTWAWVRLERVMNVKHGYAFSSDSFTSKPSPYVLTTPGNFYESGGFRHRGENTKYFKGEVPPSFILKAADLIIPMTEQAAGLLGSPAFIPDDGEKYLHNQRLGKLELFSPEIVPAYVFWFFNSTFLRKELARTCTGMKVRHTSPKRILSVPFPLPPTSEQRFIATRVEELMKLIDQMEAQLEASRTTGEKLLEAMVAELTAA
jgi:type I restriction enzyme S subunit